MYMTNLTTLHSAIYCNKDREGSLRILGRDTQTARLHNKNFAIFDIKIMWGVFAIWLIYVGKHTCMGETYLDHPVLLYKENGILIHFILLSSKLFWNNNSNLHITNTYCTSNCTLCMVHVSIDMTSFHDKMLLICHETWYMFHSLF
jgi:hypothetical protein